MTESNIEIVRGYIETVNRNEFQRVYEFCSEDCIFHVPAWVGVGLRLDVSSGQHVIVRSPVQGGNASAVLKTGDEIIQVSDAQHAWTTFQEIKDGVWGQGIPGTPLTIVVRRNGQTLELRLERGIIPASDEKLCEYLEIWRNDKLQNWPDLKCEIQTIFEKDDLVAFFAVDRGTNLEFGRSAIWSECDICRVKDGKIAEMWVVEDVFQQLTQLGYTIREPHPEPVS